MNDPDRDLAAWTAHGDRAALERVLAELLPTGTAVARSMLPSTDAEDAVQMAVMRLLKTLPAWQRRGAGAKAWFAAIVANECRNHIRHERRLRARHARADRLPPADEPLDLEELRLALADLPDHERQVVVLHHLAGHDIIATATALGCSERTARTWIAAGLARLRKRLGAAVVLLALGVAAQGAEPDPATITATRLAVARAQPPRPVGTVIGVTVAASLAAACLAIIIWFTTGTQPTTRPAGQAFESSPTTSMATPASASLAQSSPSPSSVDSTSVLARTLNGVSDDGGPPLRWIGSRQAGSDRRLVIFGHAGTDDAMARELAALLGRQALAQRWTVVVVWRTHDQEGAHPRPADALRLLAVLDREAPVPLARTVLAGVSFGGDSALAAGLSGLVPVAAVVAWPGHAPARSAWPVPTLIAGSAQDDLGWGPDLVRSGERLRAAGVPVELRLDPGSAHIPDPGTFDLSAWLERQVPLLTRPVTRPDDARRSLAAGPGASLAAAVQALGPGATIADLALLADLLGRTDDDGHRLMLIGAMDRILLGNGRRHPVKADPAIGLRYFFAGDRAGFAAWAARWHEVKR